MRKLWNDDAGFIVSSELILVATIVVIGMIVGLTTVRNQAVQELVDVGQSVGSTSQSFAFSGTQANSQAWTDGAAYSDKIDLGQVQTVQTPGSELLGVSVTSWPANTYGTGINAEQWY